MLDRLHARLVRSRGLQRFTAFTRVLLAVGFVPPGMTKVLGHRFTQLPTSHPVGSFFEAFFQAHAFYVFVGAAQVLAALLLLWPRTATLGAVLYFPIILNIAVITLAVGFEGTWVITVLMTLACLWLLVWDYDRLRVLLPRRQRLASRFSRREYAVQAALWTGVGLVVGAMAWAAQGAANGALLGALVAGGGLFGLVVAWHLRHLPEPGGRASGGAP